MGSSSLESCNKSLVNASFNVTDESYCHLFCACPETNFNNVTFNYLEIDKWFLMNANITDSVLEGGEYEEVWHEGVTWNNITVDGVEFKDATFLNCSFNSVVFDDVVFENTAFCGVMSTNIEISSTNFTNSTINGLMLDNISNYEIAKLFTNTSLSYNESCVLGTPQDCFTDETKDYNREYFHIFLIAASALPGNIVSAIAVYLFIRSYWLGIIMENVYVY